MTEEEFKFDKRPIPAFVPGSNHGQSIVSRTKKSYGNKYLQNRRSISIEDTIAERLDGIQAKREIRTKGELFKYLADLEEKIDPVFKNVFKCKKCNEEIKDIPKHINVNKFTHRDLCTDSSCKGFIVSSKEIALDVNGHVISNKGATTTNDESSETNESNDDKELVILRRGLKDDEVYRTIDDDRGRTIFLTKEENEIYNKTGKLPDLTNKNNEG